VGIIAGGSEGRGGAFSSALAERGMNVIGYWYSGGNSRKKVRET
jgi:NAD(P)-dependent dehydrogenase (short-subunit alcohol dehydrogenase family)